MGSFLPPVIRSFIFLAAISAVLAIGSIFKDVYLFRGTCLCVTGSEFSIVIAILLGVVAFRAMASGERSSLNGN
jgi:hypothetical protein